MNTPFATLRVIGYVESKLVDPMDAPTSNRSSALKLGAGGVSRGLEQTVWRYLCDASFVIYTEAAIEAAAKNHPGEEQT